MNLLSRLNRVREAFDGRAPPRREHAADVLDSGHSRIVERRTVENVMEDSYLRYSMSVIIDRAFLTSVMV